MDLSILKLKVHQKCSNLAQKKIEILKSELDSLHEASNAEIKSSVGDKYETGRVMMQNELEKQLLLLQQYQNQKANILKIQNMQTSEEIGFGSFVLTNQGNYLIAVGIGRVDKFSVISLLSPLGKAFRGLKSGDSFIFQSREYKIKSVK